MLSGSGTRSSLRSTWAHAASTVRSLSAETGPMPALERPSAIRPRNWSSRSVSRVERRVRSASARSNLATIVGSMTHSPSCDAAQRVHEHGDVGNLFLEQVAAAGWSARSRGVPRDEVLAEQAALLSRWSCRGSDVRRPGPRRSGSAACLCRRWPRRPELADGTEQLGCVPALGDHLHAGLAEQRARPGPQQHHVIGDHHAHAGCTLHRSAPARRACVQRAGEAHPRDFQRNRGPGLRICGAAGGAAGTGILGHVHLEPARGGERPHRPAPLRTGRRCIATSCAAPGRRGPSMSSPCAGPAASPPDATRRPPRPRQTPGQDRARCRAGAPGRRRRAPARSRARACPPRLRPRRQGGGRATRTCWPRRAGRARCGAAPRPLGGTVRRCAGLYLRSRRSG